ncbi:MAG: hypothetical protein KGL39_37265 [Patescibacteria group bacterium]|nr:hypothetical protein [Patescibacteria group bacterium]
MVKSFAFGLLALSLLGLKQPAEAQVAVSPAAFSTIFGQNPTGLSWQNTTAAGGPLYVGTTLTASGGTGITSANPYKWSLKINGLTVATCLTSRCATPNWQRGWTATHAGQLDTDGDLTGTNATAVYLAPQEFPSSTQVQICATDGTTTGCSTATIPTGAFPAAWVTHRARGMGMENEPYSASILTADSNPIYQALMAYFPDPFDNGWAAIGTGEQGSLLYPTTAGSDINRPSWSYDGQSFAYIDGTCTPGLFCPTSNDTISWLSPKGLRVNTGVSAHGFDTYTWDYHKPTWMIFSFWNDPTVDLRVFDTTALPISVTNAITLTATRQACGSDYCQPVMKSQIGGVDLSRETVVESNYFPGGAAQCYPAATNANCTTPGGGPQEWSIDFSNCETSLTANCATQVGTFNLNLGLGTYVSGVGSSCANGLTSWPSTSTHYDANGDPHQIYCEWGVHDFYYRRGTNELIWNYGSHSEAGEFEFFEANDNGTGVQQLYPQQANAINYPYWGHPAFNYSGNIVEYDGTTYCIANGTNICVGTGGGHPGGIGDTNLAGPSNCPAVPADYPTSLNPNCNVVRFIPTDSTRFITDYGHGAWDGWDNNHNAHDARTKTGATEQHQELIEGFWNPAMGNSVPDTVDQVMWDFGNNDSSVRGLFSPTQSPDGTKLAYSFGMVDSVLSPDLAYWFYTRTPWAPVNVTLASSSSALIQWTPAALSHETQKYWVWKQPGCTGTWSRLASVTGVYLQTTNYSYTDSALATGTSACYGVTAVEWSGAESGVLSNVIGVTNTSGAFSITSRVPGGTVNFDTTTPGSVTGLTATSKVICSVATECSGTVSKPSPITSIGPDAPVSTTLTQAVFGSTTSTTSVSPGAATITVGNTIGLANGQEILIDVGANQEAVSVTSFTGTSITATFANAHTQPFAVASLPQSVSIASQTGGVAQEQFLVDTAGNQETVVAQIISATSITATFTKSHASGVALVNSGGLTAGNYNVEYTYCKYTDFPVNTTCTETLPSAFSTASGVVTNGVLDFNTQRNEMAGQDGYCVYAELVGTDTAYHKDGCFHIPDYSDATQVQTVSSGGLFFFQPNVESNFASGFSGSMHIVLQSHNSGGAIPPVSNSTLGGYSLAWTLPADQDIRYNLILYSEGTAPSASNPWPFEIAAAPGNATSFYDGYPNQAPSGHIFYAVETLDSEGKLGGCVAYDATAGTTASCRP